jgi:hypothetical protein
MVGRWVGVGLAVGDAVELDVAEGEGTAAAPTDAELDADGPAEPEQAATAIDRIRTPSCDLERTASFIDRR